MSGANNTNIDNIDLVFYRGDTAVKKFIIKNFSDGEVYSLNGYTIKSQGRLSPDSDNVLFDVTIEDDEDGSNFNAGEIVLIVPADTTKNLPSQLQYDIEATKNNIVITLVRGSISVIPDITRD